MIISKNGINQWVFVIETQCMFWEVGADCLNSITKLESNALDYAGRSLGAVRAIRVGQVFNEEPEIEFGVWAWGWNPHLVNTQLSRKLGSEEGMVLKQIETP